MNLIIESLKRQYRDDKITEDKIRQMESEGKITSEESEYILNRGVKEI